MRRFAESRARLPRGRSTRERRSIRGVIVPTQEMDLPLHHSSRPTYTVHVAEKTKELIGNRSVLVTRLPLKVKGKLRREAKRRGTSESALARDVITRASARWEVDA